MKVLVFHIGAERYGLALPGVVRVLPAAALKTIALAPPFVAGLLDLHGSAVPVIDLSRLAGFGAEHIWFDSRIVLVDYPVAPGRTRRLGLLAEHVTGIDSIDDAALCDSGVAGAPFLGQVGSNAGGMLQLVEVAQLLPAHVRALLFAGAQEAA